MALVEPWVVIVRNPNGDEFVLNPVSDLSITENSDGVTAELDIPIHASGLPNITDLVSDVLFLRGHVLMYRMRVFSSEDKLDREQHTVSLSCASYEKILRDGRIIYEAVEMTNADQHVLAWNILQLTQARQTLGITQYANTASGVSRTTTLQIGQSVAEAIDGVAAAGDGFDWWIDAALKFRAQTPRRESLIDEEWTWGAEITEFTRSPLTETFASSVYMTGATSTVTLPGGTVYPPPAPVLREVNSMPYGRWEKAFSDSDIVTSASLIKKADWQLGISSKLRPTYSIVLEQGVWRPAVQLGGIVVIRVQINARMSFKVAARIEEMTIDASQDGGEVVSMMLRAETPEIDLDDSLPPAVNTSPNTPPSGTVTIAPPPPAGLSTTINRISDVDNLGHAITRLDERLTQQERNGGGGGGGVSEVWIGTSTPTDPSTELWYDTDADPAAVPWIRMNTLPFVNGWTDYGAPYGPAYYRKVGDEVQLRGLIMSGTVPSTVATLPVGYRPQYEPIFACDCAHLTANWTGIVEVRVTTAGTIDITPRLIPQSGWPAASAPSSWTSLSEVRFSVT